MHLLIQDSAPTKSDQDNNSICNGEMFKFRQNIGLFDSSFVEKHKKHKTQDEPVTQDTQAGAVLVIWLPHKQ